MGSTYLTEAQARDPQLLKEEAEKYAIAFYKEDDALTFHIGCSNFSTNRALVFTIEAARCLCGADNESAERLLEMARKELRATRRRKKR